MHLPESCCYFSPFLDSSRCDTLQFESYHNITPFRQSPDESLSFTASEFDAGSSNTFHHSCTIVNVQSLNVICSQYCSKFKLAL